MTSQLKPDEEFVVRSLAAHFSGEWSAGENPPDVYLTTGEETAAVEISTLMQHVANECRGMKPRLSEDSTALWLAMSWTKSCELSPKVGDGGNREGGISWGCLTPPLLHQRSDMPCPKITSSS